MFTQAVLPDTLRAIQLVSDIPHVQKAYLAGGTALALQIGHRISVDLDFFTQEEVEEDGLSADLSRLPEFQLDGTAWRSIWGKIGKTKFSLFHYKYPILKPLLKFDGIQILDKPDIAAMKIHAIEDRGTKRDFVDLYFLCQDFKLDQILIFYDQKYGVLEDHFYSITRGLDYFKDAEEDDRELEMLKPANWEEIKRFFHNESMRLAKSRPDLF